MAGRGVEAGKIDVIVSYKIDRISRSISHFYEVWNLLERCKVDFASATQEFNTGTSQGKLMLNLLLSFAQYERELIGEQTKDKIAAARKKGRWCGGKPLLGYDIDREQKRLVVNPTEAPIVRDIFAIYLERASLLRALQAVNAKGYGTKEWTTSSGQHVAGRPFDKCTLTRLLQNPVYAGKVQHHGQVYDGLHEAIVDLATFERVQKPLGDHRRHPRPTLREVSHFLLRGLVRCAACNRAMSPNYAYSRGRKYLYYTCTRATKEGRDACPIRSVSAPALENLLLERLGQIVDDEAIVAEMVKRSGVDAEKRLPAIQAERDRVEGELRRWRDEAGRLVDLIASGATATRSVHERLRDTETAIETAERRLADLADEAVRLESAVVSPAQVRAALARFRDLWKMLEPTERARLVRLAEGEVAYDGRDGEGRIVRRLHPFAAGGAEGSENHGFEHGRDWRPECNHLQNPAIKSNFELVDHFVFRSRGHELRAGPPPPPWPQPARVARELALAREIQAEIDREGLTFRDAARRHGCSRMRVCRLLALARLAPDIQAKVAGLTTTAAPEAVTIEDLRWVAEAMEWGEQRKRFALLRPHVVSAAPATNAPSQSVNATA